MLDGITDQTGMTFGIWDLTAKLEIILYTLFYKEIDRKLVVLLSFLRNN